MQIDSLCFKIDQTNAKAMIDGYLKNGMLNRQAMWCAVTKQSDSYMLITLNKTRTKFMMSSMGESLLINGFKMPHKYVALIDSEYFIKNDMRLWSTVCTNGLFDIWDPIAPYNRFANSKSNPKKFRIQLIRIYEINESLDNEVIHTDDRHDNFNSWDTKDINVLEPIIKNYEFNRIKTLLIKSINEYRTG